MARVLILEDERVVARDLQTILTGLGYDTSLAGSGEEGIEIAKQEHPDLALVDIHLAGMLDGIETARTFRDLDLAFVYLTAHSDEETLERAAATEPMGYLVKPFAEPTLKATVQMAIRKAGVERLERMEERWRRTVLDQLTVGLITTDSSGVVEMINARGQFLTGWGPEAVGKSLVEVLVLLKPDNASITKDVLKRGLRGEDPPPDEGLLRLVSKAGEENEVSHKVSRVLDEGQQTAGLSIVFWPTRQARQELDAASASAEQEWDKVTGLPGRAQARAALEASQQGQTKLFAAVFVLDRYFFTARKYGAATADEVLTYYCTFLAQEVQAQSHCRGLFRWSGPSFLALYGPWESTLIAQREVARCTRARLVEEFHASSHTVLLPISASAKVFPIYDTSIEMLISQIDAFVSARTKVEDT